jgi:hypothetical protein
MMSASTTVCTMKNNSLNSSEDYNLNPIKPSSPRQRYELACKDLQLPYNFDLSLLRKNFREQSEKIHNDCNNLKSTEKQNYYKKITEAYDYLLEWKKKQKLNLNHIEECDTTDLTKRPLERRVSELKLDTSHPKNSYVLRPLAVKDSSNKELTLDAKSFLDHKSNLKQYLLYTVNLDLKEVFKALVQKPYYEKTVNYFYRDKCLCELLCYNCRGLSKNRSLSCTVCNNTGIISWCNLCKGTGMKEVQDQYVLKVDASNLTPFYKVIAKKGLLSKDNKRGALVLNVKFENKSVIYTNNTFIIKKQLTVKELVSALRDKSSIILNLHGLNYVLECHSSKLKGIPQFVNVTKIYQKVLKKKLPFKIYFRLALVIKQISNTENS